MEVDMWPLDKRIQAKNLNLSNIGTNFNVDIKFEKDGKLHHLAQQVIDVAVLILNKVIPKKILKYCGLAIS